MWEVLYMALVEISILPIGTSSASISEYIADCIATLKKHKNVNYKLTSMGTIIEGELDDILKVIRAMHEVPFNSGALRVVTAIRIDDRRDKKLTMDSKVESVMAKLKEG